MGKRSSPESKARHKAKYVEKLGHPIPVFPYGSYDDNKPLRVVKPLILQPELPVTVNSQYADSLRKQLLIERKHCCLCGYANRDALEIHHIDGNHQNNDWSNISVLCANCHTLVTKRKVNYWDALNLREIKIYNECSSTKEK